MGNIHSENSLPAGAISIKHFEICAKSLQARFSDEKKKNEILRFVLPFEYEQYLQRTVTQEVLGVCVLCP